MNILRRSLFLQHLTILLITTSVFLGIFYQFSSSFATKKYEIIDKEIIKTTSRANALIAYNIKLNEGKIKTKELETYLDSLKSLNTSLEKIAVYEVVNGKKVVEVGESDLKKAFMPSNNEKTTKYYVKAPKNLSLLDSLSYTVLKNVYPRITTGDIVGATEGVQKSISYFPLDSIQIVITNSYSKFEDIYTAFLKASILGILSFLIFQAIFFSYLTINVLSPLNKLKKGAFEIAKGNLRAEIKVKGYDEIGVVGSFFNEVARNLRNITSELYEKDRLVGEVNIASRIQEGLIPSHAPDIPGLDMKLGYKAAEEVGGDTLDFIPIDEDNVLTYIGDVSGHGVPAGLVMTMVDVLLHGFSDVYSDISTMLINLNKHITPKIDASMFMTLLLLNWNHPDQKFTYVGAGHESIIHYKAASREIEDIKAGGIAIGMIEDNTPLVQTGELKPDINDVIVLYTDGIPEARGGDDGRQFYGMQRFKDAVQKYAIQSTADLIFQSLTEDLSRHMGKTKQADDITLVVIKYTGISAQEKNVKLSINEEAFKKESRSGKWNWNK